jgi:thiol-disulfide isomerase/thioredoxin
MIGESYYGEGDAVVELTARDFRKKKGEWYIQWPKNRPNGMVFPDGAGFLFVYATWCESCHSLRKWFETVGRQWENQFHMGAVNAMNLNGGNDALVANWGLDGFPVFYAVEPSGKIKHLDTQLNEAYLYESMLEEVERVRSIRGE